MKNLHMYSVTEAPTKFVWGIKIKEQHASTSFEKAKGNLRGTIYSELSELKDKIDVEKVMAVFDDGSDTEKYVERNNGTKIIKDRADREKVKLARGHILKVKDHASGHYLKVDLASNTIKRNDGFELNKEVKPEVQPTVKPEVKPTVKPEVKPTVKPEVKPEIVDDAEVLAQKEIARLAAEKEKAARDAIANARTLIKDINLDDLNITNYEFKRPLQKASQALIVAKGKAKEFPHMAKDIAELEALLAEKQGKVDIFKNGAEGQKKMIEEYQDKSEEMNNEMEKQVEEFKKKFEGIERDPKNLEVAPALLDPPDPQTYTEIQQGLMSHRVESMKMLEEVNFLQECGQGFAQKVADFEEEKSAFTLKNAGRFVASSALLLPGLAVDLGLWAGNKFGWNPKNKRSGDYVGDMFGADSRAEELQQERNEFQESFDEKTAELETKKDTLDAYGEKISTNSNTLKEKGPANVKAGIREKAEAGLPEGAVATEEPWKGLVDQLVSEMKATVDATVTPAINQLNAQVEDSVMEVSPMTDIALASAYDSASYIHDMNIVSATTMDMSIGFLTKNVGKGLNWVGDGLAKVPVIGFAGGVLRAAGGLVEGVGILVTDPLKVAEGLGTLVNVFTKDGRAKAGDAWGNLGSALIGGEAWKNGEYSAAIGEAVGNIASFLFTGGAVGAVKGAGIVARVGKMGAAVGKVTGKVSKVMPRGVNKFASNTGRALSRVGRPLGVAGDLALTPLRWGMKPLQWVNKTKGVGGKVNRALKPSEWAKVKPGSRAAKLKTKKLETKIKKLETRIVKDSKKWKEVGGNNLRQAIAKDRLKLRNLKKKLDGKVVSAPSKVTKKVSFGERFKNLFRRKKNVEKTTPVESVKFKNTPGLTKQGVKKLHKQAREELALTQKYVKSMKAQLKKQKGKVSDKNYKILERRYEKSKVNLKMKESTVRHWADALDGKSMLPAVRSKQTQVLVKYSEASNTAKVTSVAKEGFFASKGRVAAAFGATGLAYAGVATAKHNDRESMEGIENHVSLEDVETEIFELEGAFEDAKELTGPLAATKVEIAQTRLDLAQKKLEIFQQTLLVKADIARQGRDVRIEERKARDQERLNEEKKLLEQEQKEMLEEQKELKKQLKEEQKKLDKQLASLKE